MAFHEVIAPDEGPRFESYAAELKELQMRRAAKRGSAARALHVKQHLGATGTLTVTAPEKLRAGVFTTPGTTYPVYVRFSNGSSTYQSDKAQDQRAIALKLVGVPGKKIIPGLEDKKTQDFLCIATPAIPMSTPDEFIAFVRAAKDGPAKILPRLIGSLGLIRTLKIIRRATKAPKVSSLATAKVYTAAPIAWGATAAKVGFFPTATGDPKGAGDNQYRDDLVTRLKAGPLTWSVRAQLFVDDATTPIEDAAVVWPEDKTPYVEVATLTLPQQERSEKLDALIETFSFDPWHAVEEHRPLGAVMRARGVAYRESVLARKAADEPDAILPL